eukprot:scaffold216078_cov43-Prasinocladus_malaysianus.AAC.1
MYRSFGFGGFLLQGSHTCWYTEAEVGAEGISCSGEHTSQAHAPRTTLLELEVNFQSIRPAESLDNYDTVQRPMIGVSITGSTSSRI